jgi:hypothetical protein
MSDIVKRDGRREKYDCAKLARSLTRAGVAPDKLAGTLALIAPGQDLDTGSLRAHVESELALRQPSAARRYAITRRLVARASGQSGSGWVCMNQETVGQLGLRPGDTVWLSLDGTPAPFSVESLDEVERGQAWLNPREMAAMGVSNGTKLAASTVYHEAWSLPEEPAGFTARALT